MFGFGRNTKQEEAIKRTVMDAVADALNGATQKVKDALRLGADVDRLTRQVNDLEISKSKKEEEFAKREREVEHMVGLERKRQEFELEAAKREAIVSVREENLKAERDRFEAQMEFQSSRFTTEVGYLKEMIGRVLEAIPNVAPTKKGR